MKMEKVLIVVWMSSYVQVRVQICLFENTMEGV